ncbi:hypothetical protein [Acetobacter indonesiensis]|uniref:Uncharacterized protein n=1 Tax=Acetobacter indonesiensis TaxID=104101 RepID=A0A252AUL1_9PROT|nr:hypothetical protein [Acetobacter indonesiensis]MCG0994704.1 hypothetical protein [Acetobacter indonesiensis]MCP1229946.1 hypothetical protein [Acetobacter indonesiensis]OUI93037.1 hypothetical protein HK13_08080 [Acetobacter indonesiensis]OUI93961.1 hypothetical protein HK17_06705 [Acetobacter indonesiensis]
MSGSSTPAATVSGTPLSALPVHTQPTATDLVFGIFNGQGQFVPQGKIWSGAVDKTGDTLTGLLACALTPSDPAHLTNKAYVDKLGGQVQGTVSTLVTQAQNAATQASQAASGAAGAAATLLNTQKGTPNGLAALSASGNLLLGGLECLGVRNGHVLMALELPTTDPGVTGAWWNNGGYICISQETT